jgi:type VII secretion protein EccB
MGRQTATRLQVSGYRFLLHRMAHGLVRGDVRMDDDPIRAQSLSLIAGGILATIAIAGCAVLAFVRPQGSLDDAQIAMVRGSGALYVRIDDTWHPALNLASARLVAGGPVDPRVIDHRVMSAAKLGPSVGIPGAPAGIDPPLAPDDAAWTVCDDAAAGTTMLVGTRPKADALATGDGVLVTPQSQGSTTYLLYDGRRARVDIRDSAVVRALRLEGITPQPVSDALIGALPERPAITAPRIPHAGTPSQLGGLAVGTVAELARPDGVEYFVVLADGLQRIGEIAAELIRFTVTQPAGDITAVSPDAVARMPVADGLPVSDFPDRVQPVRREVVCASWAPDGRGGANTAVLVADSLSSTDARVVALAQSDGDGPAVDAFGIPPGRSAYIRSVGVTGEGAAGGPLFFVDGLGVVFGVRNQDAAKCLGMPPSASPAPWPLVALLPRGPELSVDSASVVRDGVSPS